MIFHVPKDLEVGERRQQSGNAPPSHVIQKARVKIDENCFRYDDVKFKLF